MPRERQAPKLLFSCGNNFSLSSFLQPVFAILFYLVRLFSSTRRLNATNRFVLIIVCTSYTQRRDVNSWERCTIYFAFAYLNPLSVYNGVHMKKNLSSFHRNVISFRNSCIFRVSFLDLCILLLSFFHIFRRFFEGFEGSLKLIQLDWKNGTYVLTIRKFPF